jgi:hypothetical protein
MSTKTKTAPRAAKKAAVNGRAKAAPAVRTGPTAAAILSDFRAKNVRGAIAQYHEAMALVRDHEATMNGVKARGEDLKPFKPLMLHACQRAYDARGHLIQAILKRSPLGERVPFGVLCDGRMYIACGEPGGTEDNWLLVEMDVNLHIADVDADDPPDDAPSAEPPPAG